MVRRTPAGKRAAGRARTMVGRGGKRVQLTPGQMRRTVQLVIAGVIFVSLVAWKLLFPDSMAAAAEGIRQALSQDADFQEAFAAVGRAVSGEEPVKDSMEKAYTAVFAPTRFELEQKEAAAAAAEQLDPPAQRLIETMAQAEQLKRETEEDLTAENETSGDAAVGSSEGQPAEEDRQIAESQSLISFSAAAPANVTFQQCILGFTYTTPAQGTMTSPFGYRTHPIDQEYRFHYGLDIANVDGTAVLAFADGTVRAVGESESLGLYVIVDHANGFSTLYGHCSAVHVSAGQAVTMGQLLADMGRSGKVTGSHLHFELHQGDTYLNPIYYVEIH